MNTRATIDDSPPPPALSVSYNSDVSYFSVALENGFRIYDALTCKVQKVRDLGQGLGCVEMIGKTNYLALVGGGKSPKFAQNKIILWDEEKAKPTLTFELRTPVQRVRISQQYVIAVLLNSIHLYKLSARPEKIKEYETTNNPWGLCCLNKDIVVFPGRTPGQVQVLELSTRNVSIIPAHSNSLRALSLSPDGTIIATASEHGTLIRLWSVGSCAKLGEFRRGVEGATIFSIALSPSNAFMAVTSDTGTLHIFDLPNASPRPSSSGRPGSISSDFGGALESGNGAADPSHASKWGFFSKIPMVPRIFSDVYSNASAKFEIGDEPELSAISARGGLNWNTPIQGVAGGRPPKGVIGWLNDTELLVIGAGQDARWERFRVGVSEDGRRAIMKDGWKKILE
ncbi:WD40-repeat-containing domain protein [Macrophomina phaseolina]|uniref:WD40-repeat-containing domain protein n=1 Tax=Macrophomina phaseolina TaxID=35725 RepID=A0ABQ8GRP9_9PEZI|nr:WD40-repeat-containing domain protein [Macrophomina phaseolina]